MISQPFLWLIHVMNTVNVCPQWIRHWAWIYVYELITRMQQLYTISWVTLLTHIKRQREGKRTGSRRRQATRETRANKDREEKRATEEKDFKSRPQIKAMFASWHAPLREKGKRCNHSVTSLCQLSQSELIKPSWSDLQVGLGSKTMRIIISILFSSRERYKKYLINAW